MTRARAGSCSTTRDSFQRQGAAVFYNAIQGASAATQRAQLRTYVHELGHAFNLLHSWDKGFGRPAAAARARTAASATCRG